MKIKRALISVSDKTGIVEFAKELNNLGVEIISTGGTARLLKQNNIPVVEISDYTGFPEILDGRVKTLHPKVFAGILALRDNPQHLKTLQRHNITLVDMVVVNLYPFCEVTKNKDIQLKEAIENIDIGGPSLLRASAKNYSSVVVVCNPKHYPLIIKELKEKKDISLELRQRLMLEAFAYTSYYDTAIYNYFNRWFFTEDFPERVIFSFDKVQDLRYGENPHQKACFYKDSDSRRGVSNLKQLAGKELSFNNLLDINSAVNLIREFKDPAVCFIKHNNPCGVAENRNILKAYTQAFNADKLSAFGGIVGINRKVEKSLAELILKSGFLECVVAVGFSPEAIEALKEKKNLRIIELANLAQEEEFWDFKKVDGGLLLQKKDIKTLDENNLKIVSKKKPTKKQFEDLAFAWKVVKHVKSNAIVIAKDKRTLGIGAGQMSRVDSVFMAIRKAKINKFNLEGACLASDAFFPKEDAVRLACQNKIKAIIQPGGSVEDHKIIELVDKYGVSMVFTGIRHFRH